MRLTLTRMFALGLLVSSTFLFAYLLLPSQAVAAVAVSFPSSCAGGQQSLYASISTNKSSYVGGEVIAINGIMTLYGPSGPATYNLSANGASVVSGNFNSGTTGSGTTNLTAPATPGTYNITMNASASSCVGSAVTAVIVTAPAPAACTLPWGGSIPSGSSVVAYQSTSVVSPAACVSQTRACTSGALSGTYANPSCTVSGPSAMLSASPATCTIALGASICTVPFTWSISGAITPNLYNATTASQYSVVATGSSVAYPITNGVNTVQARNGATVLSTVSVTGDCISGSAWSAGSCVSTSIPTATIITPIANESVQQNQTVYFSGTGTPNALAPGSGTLVGTYAAGGNPLSVAFDPSTNSVWVGSSNAVMKFDALTGAVVGTYPLLGINAGIAFDPSTNSMWVTNYYSNLTINRVFKLNASNGAIVGTYGTGVMPTGVVFDPSTNSIWVANYNSHTVTKLNASNGTLIGNYGAGNNPGYLAFDSSTNSIWVTNDHQTITTNIVRKINAATGATIGAYASAYIPYGIAYDSFTNSVWVSGLVGNSVAKLNASDGVRVLYFTAGGSRPNGVAFDTSTNSVWITNTLNASMSVTKYNSTTGAIIGTYSVGAKPFAVAFDGASNSMWIANWASHTVTKLRTGANTITAYEWREGNCTVGTLLSTAPSFDLATPTVSAGRTIYLRVRSSQGVWSTNCPSRVITVASLNSAPSAPIISGPVTTEINVAQTYSFVSTDAQNNQIRYGVDWNMDTVADEWFPAGVTYVNSGTPQSTPRSWSTPGVKTFQVLAQDAPGLNSAWTIYSVTVTSPLPTTTLSSALASIPYNTATTLSWSSTNATGCTAGGSWSGAKAVSGSVSTGLLLASQTYTLYCTGPGGNSVAQSATVTVGPPAPTAVLSALSTSIPYNTATTLSWSSTNATGCTAGGAWSGAKAVSGSVSTGLLLVSQTYTLLCSGAGGDSAVQSVMVTVGLPPPDFVFSALPTAVVNNGTSLISWFGITDATSCSSFGGSAGWFSVVTPITGGSWTTGTLSSSGSPYTYSLTCSGPGGSVTKTATITVAPPSIKTRYKHF